MCVHVFGNTPSPAVATYCLRQAVQNSDKTGNSDVIGFVTDNFYVDDGLISLPTDEEAIDLMQRTQTTLKMEGNIRLHKITSNSTRVMRAFPNEDLGKDLKSLSVGQDVLPIQRSLGISWDLTTDDFIFEVQLPEKPYTKRGLLSTINGIFDPMGFAAPFTLKGKLLLRDATPVRTDWDKLLSPHLQEKWEDWRLSIASLCDLRIPRMYDSQSLSLCTNLRLVIFSDASENAVAAVAYLRFVNDDGSIRYGFVMGKSKIAPSKGNTIPRLELCGAVLAVELGETLSEHLSIEMGNIQYFTDSKVVLGYIRNETRRFYTYVSNRVDRIRNKSSPTQWNFVPTTKNPADCGTRANMNAKDLPQSMWLSGPNWPRNKPESDIRTKDSFPLVEPQNDREIRPDITVRKTTITTSKDLGTRFQRFSRWWGLVKAITSLIRLARSFRARKGLGASREENCINLYQVAETAIIKIVQIECFTEEILCLSHGKELDKESPISRLSPFLDQEGVLRVGGRISKMKGIVPSGQINPIILPKNHHISTLLIGHYHEKLQHQGRHLTEGALRSAGYWVISAKRSISSLIHKCLNCRRLRRNVEHQRMADLPLDRLTPGPPFTSVGVDMFGPWNVVTRKTRSSSAESKRWAIMFTCLTTRAVHIEVQISSVRLTT